jgi:hypothetical protein
LHPCLPSCRPGSPIISARCLSLPLDLAKLNFDLAGRRRYPTLQSGALHNTNHPSRVLPPEAPRRNPKPGCR